MNEAPEDPSSIVDATKSESASENETNGLVLPSQILPPNLFVLPMNSSIIYPSLMAPLMVNLPQYVTVVEEAIQRNRIVGILLTREDELRENVPAENLYSVGVVVKILKRLKYYDTLQHTFWLKPFKRFFLMQKSETVLRLKPGFIMTLKFPITN